MARTKQRPSRSLAWIKANSAVLDRLEAVAGDKCLRRKALRTAVSRHLNTVCHDRRQSLESVEASIIYLWRRAEWRRDLCLSGYRPFSFGGRSWWIEFGLSRDMDTYVKVTTPRYAKMLVSSVAGRHVCKCPAHRAWRSFLLLATVDQLETASNRRANPRRESHLAACGEENVSMAMFKALQHKTSEDVPRVQSLAEIALRKLAVMPAAPLNVELECYA